MTSLFFFYIAPAIIYRSFSMNLLSVLTSAFLYVCVIFYLAFAIHTYFSKNIKIHFFLSD